MASQGTWTVVFDDKMIINQSVKNEQGHPIGYVINDDSFWSQAKFSNVWAIQYGTSNVNDQVEYRDETAHSSWADAALGDINDFVTRWDSAHLARLQSDWDNDNASDDETNEEKVARLGARPTSYSS
jgi:hypothetical protein